MSIPKINSIGVWVNPNEAAELWASQSLQQTRDIAQHGHEAAIARDKNTKVSVPLKPQTISNKKEDAIKLLEQLTAAGYDLGKIDGIIGRKTNEALAKAKADGYVWENGKLSRPESKPNYAEHELQKGRDFLNYVARISPFTNRPFKGTEEDARKLGYEHYTENGFDRKKVNYSIEGSENMTPQQRALALLDKYGITEEQVRDKSPVSKLVYNYSPGYGYNFLRMGENIIRGNKVRENGKRITEKIETPVADKITNFIAKGVDFIGMDKFANDLRESNTYDINESSARNDLSNLYFGYPMNGKSIKISKRSETGKGNKPEQGYFYEFRNDSHIYNDPAYKNTIAGGRGVLASGENMGSWAASVDASGNKAYYDKWDINPFTHIPGLEKLPNMNFLGTGFELYGKQNS